MHGPNISDREAWKLTNHETKKMKERLYNLALIDTINFCKANNIDCSGTYLKKATRGFTYSLLKTETGRGVVTVTFHKSSVPTHTVFN